jgi:hypothetical protein
VVQLLAAAVAKEGTVVSSATVGPAGFSSGAQLTREKMERARAGLSRESGVILSSL